MVSSSKEGMDKIQKLLSSGTVRAHVSNSYSLDQIRLAHEALETGRTIGKIVVTV